MVTGSYVKPNIASLGNLIFRGMVLPSKIAQYRFKTCQIQNISSQSYSFFEVFVSGWCIYGDLPMSCNHAKFLYHEIARLSVIAKSF